MSQESMEVLLNLFNLEQTFIRNDPKRKIRSKLGRPISWTWNNTAELFFFAID